MKRSIPPPTKAESERLRRISDYGCIVSRLKWHIYVAPDIQHINDGGRNMGHWFTIALSPWLHRGIPDACVTEADMIRTYGHSIIHGSKLFERDHGTQKRLWLITQRLFRLDRTWPSSKIVPRRCA